MAEAWAPHGGLADPYTLAGISGPTRAQLARCLHVLRSLLHRSGRQAHLGTECAWYSHQIRWKRKAKDMSACSRHREGEHRFQPKMSPLTVFYFSKAGLPSRVLSGDALQVLSGCAECDSHFEGIFGRSLG